MKSPELFACLLLSLLVAAPAGATGFATRELNPILQPVFLPSMVQMSTDHSWRIEQNFYITNWLLSQGRDDENLTIDFENYRYEFDLSRRRNNWLTQIRIPLMATRGGQLDGVIEDWHELFGFPNGKRDRFPQDQVNIEYIKDGVVEYSQTEASEGIGDIAFTLGYQQPGRTAWFVGIELPTGSADDFTGNESIDLALWLTRELRINDKANAFGMLGVSFPGDDGNLAGLVVDRIWVAQLGFDYRFRDDYVATVQFDMHSRSIEGSDFRAFNESYQVVIGLGFLRLLEKHRLDLFFTEDVLVRSAPDITFGLRLAREF